eukprot:1752248-Lingulodinium_polyedra.AAC.1
MHCSPHSAGAPARADILGDVHRWRHWSVATAACAVAAQGLQATVATKGAEAVQRIALGCSSAQVPSGFDPWQLSLLAIP